MQIKLDRIFSRDFFLNALMTVILVFLAREVAVFIPNLANPSISLWLQSSLPIFILALLFTVVAIIKFNGLPLFGSFKPITLGRLFLLLLLSVFSGLITFTIISMQWGILNMLELFIIMLAVVIPLLPLIGKTSMAIFMLFLSLPVIELLRKKFGITAGSVLNPFLIYRETIAGQFPESGFLGYLPFEALLVTGLFGGWLLNLYLRQGRWPRTPLDLPIAIFLIGCLASIPFSSDISKSMAFFIWGGLVPFMLYYVIVDCVKMPMCWSMVLLATLLSAVTIESYNIYTAIQSTSLSIVNLNKELRIGMLFWARGIFITVYLSVIFTLYMKWKGYPVRKILILLILLAGFANILVSFARIMWLIIAMQMLFMSLFVKKIRPYIVAFILILAVILFSMGDYLQIIKDNIRPKIIEGLEEGNWDILSSGRVFLWQKSYEWIQEKPLQGMGLGTSTVYFLPYGQTNPHNEYLHLWLEAGILPGLAMLVIEFIVLVESVRSIKYTKHTHFKEMRYCIFLTCVSWFILSLISSLWMTDITYALHRVVWWGFVVNYSSEKIAPVGEDFHL